MDLIGFGRNFPNGGDEPPKDESGELDKFAGKEKEKKPAEKKNGWFPRTHRWIREKHNLLIGLAVAAIGFQVVVLTVIATGGDLRLGLLSGEVLLAGAYIAIGLKIVKQAEYIIIERFGKYLRTAKAGITILCLPGLVDKVAHHGSFKLQRTDLYSDEEGNEIDFTDASAPVKAQVWWRVVGVVEMGGKFFDGPFLFHYRISDPEGRIEEVMDSMVRHFFAGMTLDEASKNKALAREVLNTPTEKPEDEPSEKKEEEDKKKAVAESAIAALREIGVQLDDHKGLVVSDITIPKDIQDLRAKKLEGEKDAQKAAARGAGYAQAIAEIIAKAKVAGQDITWSEAREIYERQRALEAYEKTGAKNTFISPNIGVSVGMLLDTTGGGKEEKK